MTIKLKNGVEIKVSKAGEVLRGFTDPDNIIMPNIEDEDIIDALGFTEDAENKLVIMTFGGDKGFFYKLWKNSS